MCIDIIVVTIHSLHYMHCFTTITRSQFTIDSLHAIALLSPLTITVSNLHKDLRIDWLTTLLLCLITVQEDFQSIAQNLTFSPSSPRQCVEVPINDDDIDEEEMECLVLQIIQPGVVPSLTTLVCIVDDGTAHHYSTDTKFSLLQSVALTVPLLHCNHHWSQLTMNSWSIWYWIQARIFAVLSCTCFCY